MSGNIRRILVLTLAAGLMWHCGGERVTQSQTETAGPPLGKLTARGHASQAAAVRVNLSQDGAAVSGAKVEFSRSIAGRAASYQWAGMTDEMGQARVEIAADKVTGYYLARAMQGGSEIGSWSSIPINAGYEAVLNLPIGGKARVTSSAMLTRLEGEIPIGLVLSLTGRIAATGATMKNGFEMALAEINRSGMLDGATLKFIIEDDESTVEGAAAAYTKLIARDGVAAVLGPFSSSATQAAFPIAQENEVVAISPTSAARGLSALGDYLFRISLTVDALLPGGVATTQAALGYRRVATIVQAADAFSRSSDEVFKAALRANGVEVLTTETFQSDEVDDLSAQLTRIKALNPDAIFISTQPPGRTQIPIQARQLGISTDIPFLVTLMTIDDVLRTGGALEGAISFTTWSNKADPPGNRAFVARFREQYGSEPGAFTAQSYASVYILAQAIADAKSTESSAIRDALAAIDVSTVLGHFSFDANGDAVYDPIILTVKNDRFEVFDPQASTGEKRMLKVGFYAFFEPLSYSATPDPMSPGFGEHRGYEADLLTALEAMKGERLSFVRHPIAEWPDIWLKPTEPQYDLVGGGITILDSRTRDAMGNQVVAFTDGHIDFRQSLLVRAEDAQRLASHADLTSAVRVGVLAGTTGEARLLELTGLVDDNGILAAGVRVETARDTVVADGSADYVITSAGASPVLMGRRRLHPPSETMPQVVYLGDETGETALLNALRDDNIDAVARGEIGNRTAVQNSGNAFAVTALDPQIELGGFAVAAENTELLTFLNARINFLTDNRRIGYAEWLTDTSVFTRRAAMWSP